MTNNTVDIVEIIKKNNYIFVDERINGGPVWLFGVGAIKAFIDELQKSGVKFTYGFRGGVPGWWTRNYDVICGLEEDCDDTCIVEEVSSFELGDASNHIEKETKYENTLDPEDIPFYKKFELVYDLYDEILIESLCFSVRVEKRLLQNNILTVSDLLQKTPFEIKGFGGIGNTSINEIEKYIASLKNKEVNSSKKQLYVNVHDVLGDDLVNVLTEERTRKCVMDILKGISLEMEAYRLFNDALREIPLSRLENKAYGYIVAYSLKDEERESLLKYLDNDSESLASFLESIRRNGSEVMLNCLKFTEWLSFDMVAEVKTIFDNVLVNNRTLEVVKRRSSGQTLEEVGSYIGITRERVRQIEAKAQRNFNKAYLRYRILSKIYADRDCDTVLTLEEVSSHVGAQSELFLYFVRNHVDRNISYNKKLKVFIVADDTLNERVAEFVDQLPEMFFENDLVDIYSKAYSEYDLTVEILEKAINETYKLSGNVYYRNRLKRAEIITAVIREYFPDGIHVSDDVQITRLRKCAQEKFGDVKLPSNNRALSARIMDSCIICDRGTYRAKNDAGEYISEELAKRIYEYIVSDESKIFLTGAIYDKFENELVAEQVTNKYYLHGILRELYYDKFVFYRDYISKDADLRTIYSSIIDYIKASEVPVPKSDIQSKFPGVTDIMISIALSENTDILSFINGYFSGDRIKVSVEEKGYLEGLLSDVLNDGKIHNSKELYRIINSERPEILRRNFALYQYCTFSLLENLFRDKFYFKRPFVSISEINLVNQKQLIRDLIYENNAVRVEEIFDLVNEYGVNVTSYIEFIVSCNDRFLLANSSTLLTIEETGITEEIASMVEDILSEHVLETTPIRMLECGSYLPEIKVPWSDWLVYSVLRKWGKKFDVATTSPSFRMATPLVAPKGEMNAERFSTLPAVKLFVFEKCDNLDDIDDLLKDVFDDEALEAELWDSKS